MALRGGPHRSSSSAVAVPGWRPLDFLRFETHFLDEGVVQGVGTNLAVSQHAAGANMQVDVAAGLALIEVTTTLLSPNETHKTWLYNDDVYEVTVPTADATNPRKDRIVADFDMSVDPNGTASNVPRIRLIAGTPAGSPSAPAEPSNAITLAIIDVPASDTTIGTAQITDSRTYALLTEGILKNITRQGLGNMAAAGSGTNTQTATYSPAVTALTDKTTLILIPSGANTGAATFSPNGLSAKDIRKYGNTALEANDLKANFPAVLQYNSLDDNWKLLSIPGNSPAVSTLTVEDKTADYSVASSAAEQGKVFTNTGAAAAVVMLLPTWGTGMNYEFVVSAAQPLILRPMASATESLLDAATPYIGYYSVTPYSTVRVVGAVSNKWNIMSKTGTWVGMIRKGYCAGGTAGGSLLQYLKFSDETRTNLAATLSSVRRQSSGISGLIAGYYMGGLTAGVVATIDKMKYADETCAALAATLDTAAAFEHEGVQSATKGYTTHSDAGSTAIEDMNFSADTSAVIGATITSRSASASSTHRGTAGYFLAGANAGAQDDIYKLTFSGEAVSTLGALLPANRSQLFGNVYSATKGYVAGGSIATTAIYSLTFSGETTATVTDTLDDGRKSGGGFTEYTLRGFWFGGEDGGGASPTDEIAGFTFSSETCADIAAVLSSATYLIASGNMNIGF